MTFFSKVLKIQPYFKTHELNESTNKSNETNSKIIYGEKMPSFTGLFKNL